MSTPALSKTIEIQQGADFQLGVILTDSNGDKIILNDAIITSQFRRSYGSPVVLDLSSSDGSIEVIDNYIILNVPASVTSTIVEKSGLFDIKVFHHDGRVERILEGRWTLSLEVTV